MSRSAQATIERLQPYHRRKNPNARSLWVLEELANIDKHRLVHPTATALTGTEYRLTPTGGLLLVRRQETFFGPLKENAMVSRFTVSASVPPFTHVDVEADTVLDVIFDKRSEAKSARGLPVAATLDGIMGFVADEVMPALVELFPGLQYGVDELPPVTSPS